MLTKHRAPQAVATLKKMAKFNGKEIQTDLGEIIVKVITTDKSVSAMTNYALFSRKLSFVTFAWTALCGAFSHQIVTLWQAYRS